MVIIAVACATVFVSSFICTHVTNQPFLSLALCAFRVWYAKYTERVVACYILPEKMMMRLYLASNAKDISHEQGLSRCTIGIYMNSYTQTWHLLSFVFSYL